MSENELDLPQGTLELLILKAVALQPEHGWAIARRIGQLSSEVLQVRQGSLYPALHRLENKGWIRSSWGTSENNRRAKYYEITPAGQRRLERDTRKWERLVGAVGRILEATSA